jgi:dienelactone hydrolase
MNAVVEWVTKTAPLDATVKEVFEVVIKHLESTCTSPSVDVGMVGFCWGGKIAMLSSAQERIKASVGIHPSFLKPEDAANAKCPQMLLPAGNAFCG